MDSPIGRPDPWRGYLACIAAALETDCSHAVIVQDDAILCYDFACWLGCYIDEHADQPLVLFCAAQPRVTALGLTRAHAKGERFMPLAAGERWMPAVGICWPRVALEDLSAWTRRFSGRVTRSDDHMLGQWHQSVRGRFRPMVTIPSLVQHPDDVPSMVGNGAGSNGRNPARVALIWDG